MSGCRHEWHDYHRLSFPCPDCGAWADEGNSSATDYHELPEVPRCCLTCTHSRNKHRSMLLCTNERVDINNRRLVGYASVVPHGLCSHWEKRDDGG